MNNKTKRIVWMAMLIALSVVGSYIKIPGPFQSIALDAMPAFLAALMLGAVEGAFIGFLGHILTAASAGFYLTLPIHLIVVVMMAITMVLFNRTYRYTSLWVAGLVGILLNGIGAPLVLALFPQFGWPFFIGITPVLALASAVNVIAAILIYNALQRSKVQINTGIEHHGK